MIQNTKSSKNTKSTIVLRTKSSSLENAIEKNNFYNNLEQENNTPYHWLIGIESDSIPMFDIDRKVHISVVEVFATRIRNAIAHNYNIDNNVMIIETENGYHVISNAELSPTQWIQFNESVLVAINKNIFELPIDKAHLELNIKYKKTTLRISNKYPLETETYKVIKVI